MDYMLLYVRVSLFQRMVHVSTWYALPTCTLLTAILLVSFSIEDFCLMARAIAATLCTEALPGNPRTLFISDFTTILNLISREIH